MLVRFVKQVEHFFLDCEYKIIFVPVDYYA
jgi:hypothetical protein